MKFYIKYLIILTFITNFIVSCNYKVLAPALKYDSVYKKSDNILSNPIGINNHIAIPATELKISGGDIVLTEKEDSQSITNLETVNKNAVYNSTNYLFSKAPVKSNTYINKLVRAQLYNPLNKEKVVRAEIYKPLIEDEIVPINFNYKTILKFRYFNGDKMFIKDSEGKLLVDKVYNLLTKEQKKKFKKIYTIINIK